MKHVEINLHDIGKVLWLNENLFICKIKNEIKLIDIESNHALCVYSTKLFKILDKLLQSDFTTDSIHDVFKVNEIVILELMVELNKQ